MKKGFFVFILLWTGACLHAQEIRFPQDYLGTWAGTLHLYPSGQTIEMSLQIGPKKENSSRYDYILTYHAPKGDDRREYELEPLAGSPNRFRVDEKNSIILEETLMGNALISIFSVSGSSLVITMKLETEKILFEVISWDDTQKAETGGKEDVPVVYTYLSNGYQRAELNRRQR